MKKRSEQAGRSMIYEVGDVTKMSYSNEKFNVVIDKGTLGEFRYSLTNEPKTTI